ncbi:unnamed protein product [Diplocarpon coronariae]|uniref:Uncharacterized protein n=1 Tax=Diplocarpon coronariae TaxID=2795749 RepID=A0A218ZDB4_9HELO|nr:hypothetical protein B2J93_6331 [Marssonina coronariae]
MADPINGAVPPGDNNSSGLYREPEQNFTPENLAMIQDAMMAELGIGRKDELPLDDPRDGEDISILVSKPKKTNMLPATAVWRNLVFDDVDPAHNELDSIADGQLYRLRKGDASSALSRARGNGASRGGRGGGRGRGGRQVGPGYSPSMPQSFFAARAAVNSQPQAEYAASRLSDPVAPAPFSGTRKQDNWASCRDGHQDQANAPPSRRPKPLRRLNALPMKPRFALTNGNEAFLAHAGYVQHAAPPARAAESQQKPLGPSQCLNRVDMSSAPKAPLADRIRQLNLSKNSLPRDTRASDATASTEHSPILSRGISVSTEPSISAATTREPPRVISPVQVQSPPVLPESVYRESKGLLSSRWAPAVTPAQISDRVAHHSYAVKFKKDQGPTKAGTAELVKNSTDQYFTLQLVEAATDHVIVKDLIADDAVFEQDRNLVIYRAGLLSTLKPPTWRLIFPLPHMADRFAHSVLLSRQGRTVAQPSAPSDIIAAQTSSDVEPALHPASVASVDTFPHGAPELENHTIEDLISLEPETELPPKPVNPYLIEFLEVENEDIINGLFGRLKEGISCTVLGQLSDIVVGFGGTPAHELSSDDILSSPDYQFAIRVPVSHLLKSLETFYMLPDDVSNMYLLDKSQKVLAMAVAERHLDQGGVEASRKGENVTAVGHTRTTITTSDGSQSNVMPDEQSQPTCSRASSDVHLLHPSLPYSVAGFVALERTDVHQPESSLESTPTQTYSTEHPGVLEPTVESRVKYSPETLLGLRSNAVPVEINVQFPRRAEQSPRRPARGIAPPKPVANMGGWKCFADMSLYEAYLFTAGPTKPVTSQSIETTAKPETPFGGNISESVVPSRVLGAIAALKQSPPSPAHTLRDVDENDSFKTEAADPLVKDESHLPHPTPQASTHVAPVLTETVGVPAPRSVAVEQDLVDGISNLNLRGASGLSSSQWASSASASNFTSRNLQAQMAPSIAPLAVPREAGQWHAASQPTSPIFRSPPATTGAPVYQTVFIIDVATGELVPITGVLNPQQLPPMTNHYGIPDTSATPSFQAREASGSDKGCAPGNIARPASDTCSATGGQRPVLSPRKGNVLQARLQSRLSNSMAAGRGSYQGLRF